MKTAIMYKQNKQAAATPPRPSPKSFWKHIHNFLYKEMKNRHF